MPRSQAVTMGRGLESLERRRALAVAVSAPIEDFVMPIGSAVQPVSILLPDHFSGGGSSLEYSVTTSHGYVTTIIDAAGTLTIRPSSLVPPGFVTAIDNLVVRATSKTNSGDHRELAFAVFQKTPVRVANAMVVTAGGSAWVGETELNGQASWPRLKTPVALQQPPALQPAPGDGDAPTYAGDFNGDHADDLAWIDSRGRVWVLTTVGNPGVSSPTTWGGLPEGVRWQSVTVGDFTGDGLSDIAVRNPHNGNWRVLVSDGGHFGAPLSFGNWSPRVDWQHMVTGDFDGNATTDLAARDPETGHWWVSRSTDIGFVTTRFGTLAAPWQSFFAGDFNGDGRSDIAGRNPFTGRWRVLTSHGDQFGAAAVFGEWSIDVAWADLRIGDFDGDGRSDLAGRNPTTGDWLVSRSTGTGFTTSTFGSFANPQVWQSFIAGDFNFDGKTDIVARNRITGTWRMLRSAGDRFEKATVVGAWPTATAWSNLMPIRIGYDSATSSGGFSSGSLLLSNTNFSYVNNLPALTVIPPTPKPEPTLIATGTLTGTIMLPNGSGTITHLGTAIFGVGTLDRELSLVGGGVTPGDSLSRFGALGTSLGATFGPKGFYSWELQASRVDGTAGTDWDLLRVRDALQITATTAEPFLVSVIVVGTQGTNFHASRDYVWTIAEADGGISGFAPEKFLISAPTNPFGSGHLTLVQNGNALELRYTA